MKISIVTIGLLLAGPFLLQACVNTQPTYYSSYPAYSGVYDSEPQHGYEPYAYAPYDPYGGYYQNFYPTPTFYYEPPYHEHHCDDRPCAPARQRAEPDSIKPRLIPPPEPHASRTLSTISRSHSSPSSRSREGRGDRD